MINLLNILGLSRDGILYSVFLKYNQTEPTKAFIAFVCGLLICIIIPYLLGSFNSAIIVSKYLFKDDIRKYGSGNAGLTNMQRVYGKKGAMLTLVGDVVKQILSVFVGVLFFGIQGAYIAGTFCIIGHILPIYYRFRGGKGVLCAATMIAITDPAMFFILFGIFALVLITTKFVSLSSITAGFCYPGLVYMRAKFLYGTAPELPILVFSIFIGLLIILMHRENIKRLYNNEEKKFSFKREKENENKKDKK